MSSIWRSKTPASTEDEGESTSSSRPRRKSSGTDSTGKKSTPSRKSKWSDKGIPTPPMAGFRLSRILRSATSHQHLPTIPPVPPILIPTSPPTPPKVPSSSDLGNASLGPSSLLSPGSPTTSTRLRHSKSIDSSLPPLTATRSSPLPPPPPSPPPTLPTISTAPVAWDHSITARLRQLSAQPIILDEDGAEAEADTDWETDGGLSITGARRRPNPGSGKSKTQESDFDFDSDFYGSGSGSGEMDIRSSVNNLSMLSAGMSMMMSSNDEASESEYDRRGKGKGKARAYPASTFPSGAYESGNGTTTSGGNSLVPPRPRHQTLSNASSASSFSPRLSRHLTDHPPPPVPTLPAEFLPSKSKQPALSVRTQPSALNESFDGELDFVGTPELVIGVVGASGCGKTGVTRKGMKAWGVGDESTHWYGNIKVRSRFANVDPHGHTRPVQILEIDSEALLVHAPPSLAAIRAGDGLWAWPRELPHVDGVLVCYDVGDLVSFRGVAELCAGYHELELPTVVVQCKSDIEHVVPSNHAAGRASAYSIGLVETSTRTEAGKKKTRDSFNWLMKAIMRARRGELPGDKLRNPASPDIFDFLPSWEMQTSSEFDDFLPSFSSAFAPTITAPHSMSPNLSRPQASQPISASSTRTVTPTGLVPTSTPMTAMTTPTATTTPSGLRPLRLAALATSPVALRASRELLSSSSRSQSPTTSSSVPKSPTRARSASDLLGMAVRAAAAGGGTSVGGATSPISATGNLDPAPALSGNTTPRPSVSMSNLRASFAPTMTTHLSVDRGQEQDKDNNLDNTGDESHSVDATPKVSVLVVAPKTPKEPPPMQFAPFEEIMDKLIYLAVTEDDPPFMEYFFTTHRRFATSRNVILGIQKRMLILSADEGDKLMAKYAQMKIANMTEQWMDMFPHDFNAKGANAAFVGLLKTMIHLSHTMHYASDMCKRLPMIRQLKDRDEIWTIKEGANGYASDVEDQTYDDDAEAESANHGMPEVRIAVTTTTTTVERIEEEDEEDGVVRTISSGALGMGMGVSHRLSISSTAIATHRTARQQKKDKEKAAKSSTPAPPSSFKTVIVDPKTAKRTRSTSSFGLLNLESMTSPYKSRALSTPAPAVNLSPKAVLDRLCKAADMFMKIDVSFIAEEITRTQMPMFLAVRPRDWLRHTYRRTHRGEKGHKRDHIDKLSIYFNHLSMWITSIILAHPGFKQRSKVMEKSIQLARALRGHNNYAGLRAVVSGINNARYEGDVLSTLVATRWPRTYKSLQSMEVLLGSTRMYSAYRMALRNSPGPAIPDMEVHTSDMARANDSNPPHRADEPHMLHWGKYALMGKMVRNLNTYRRRFEDYPDIFKFPERKEISDLILNSTLMDEDMKYRRNNPIDPLDGSANPTATKVKRFFQTLASA